MFNSNKTENLLRSLPVAVQSGMVKRANIKVAAEDAGVSFDVLMKMLEANSQLVGALGGAAVGGVGTHLMQDDPNALHTALGAVAGAGIGGYGVDGYQNRHEIMRQMRNEPNFFGSIAGALGGAAVGGIGTHLAQKDPNALLTALGAAAGGAGGFGLGGWKTDYDPFRYPSRTTRFEQSQK